MSDAGYIFAGYAVTAAVVAAYVGWIMRKARELRAPAEPPGLRGPNAVAGALPPRET